MKNNAVALLKLVCSWLLRYNLQTLLRIKNIRISTITLLPYHFSVLKHINLLTLIYYN